MSTFVNDLHVDDWKSEYPIYANKIGFIDRSDSRQKEIYIDDVSVTYTYADGSSEVYLHDDFESGISHNFLEMEIAETDGSYRGHIKSDDKGYYVEQMNSHQPVFYTDFRVDKEIESAWLYTSAIGNYDAFINGERVGTLGPDGTMVYEELKPGWTDFRSTVCYFSHDVTSLCRVGDNMIGIELNKGYAHGDNAHNIYASSGLSFISVLGKLVLTYTDGSREVIGTDESWLVSKRGPLMDGDVCRGEYFDARYPYPWQEGYDAKPFAAKRNEVKAAIVPFTGPAVVAVSSLKPVSTTIYDTITPCNDFGKIAVRESWDGPRAFTLKKGETAIVDFGQNTAGVPRIKVRGKRGTRLKMRFAERLNDTGLASLNNDGPEGSIYRKNYRSENVAVQYYTLSGGSKGEEHRAYSTFYGHRYCDITANDDIEIISLESVPLTSSHDLTGDIVTDNEDVNRIFTNTIWGQLSNMINIPIDCPSRNEKVGWAGDINTMTTTVLYNARLSEFLRKWLRDLRDGQLDSGAYRDIAPHAFDNGAIGHTAWADAGVLVTWNLYLMTGNVDIIRENYQSMRRFMDYTASLSVPGVEYPGTVNQFGDWWGFGKIDMAFMSEAYYAITAREMSKMAGLLSKVHGDEYDYDSKYFASLYYAIVEEMQRLYFDADGLINPTQGACAMAIYFDIFNDAAQRDAVGGQLARLLEENGHKLNTGFVCTQFLLPVLSETGHADEAYRVLMQRDCPSWLFMIDNGGTTFWELWDGWTPEKGFFRNIDNSFNHLAYGSVVEWMYRYMAGIKVDEGSPAFKHIVFKPYPDPRLGTLDGSDLINDVKASHDSPYGPVSARWHKDGSTYFYDIEVPCNTTAEVWLPMSAPIFVNDVPAISAPGVTCVGEAEGRYIFNVLPGRYTFRNDVTTDVETPVLPEVAVFPNPVADRLYVVSSAGITGLELYDLSGRVIAEWHGGESVIDMSWLQSPGVFMFKIATVHGSIVKKIIKKRQCVFL